MSLTKQEAEEFLCAEANLLDDRCLEEWLELFTEDGVFWIPIDENADPEMEPSVLYDDSTTRAQRVYQLLHQPHYAQRPASRTIHFISNVSVAEATEREALVRCNVIVYELRPGDDGQFGIGEQRSIAGRCEYRLRRDGDRWRIAHKKVVLINRDLALENMTFII